MRVAPSIDTLFALALRHYRAGSAEQAAGVLEQVLRANPCESRALLLLALVRDAVGDVAGGAPLLVRYVALCPADGFAWHRLGRVQQTLGDDQAACVCFTHAAALRPGDAGGLNDLGACQYRCGEPDLALSSFQRAAALEPGTITVQANLARLLDRMQRPAAAEAALHAVLAATPRDGADRLEQAAASLRLGMLDAAETMCREVMDAEPVGAGLLLAEILERCSRQTEAKTWRSAVGRVQGVVRHPCLGRPEAKLLLIAAAGLCNLPTDFLIDRSRFEVSIVQLPPDADGVAGLAEQLRDHDVAFNVVGDADAGASFLPAVTALGTALGHPLANAPDLIMPTRRDKLAATLRDIPGLDVPNTLRWDRANEPPPMPYPLLARPAGTHGGNGLIRIHSDKERDQVMAACGADAVYLSEYRDTRSADGWFRKYRLAFVGGVVFPVHLAICADWLVHYWRAEMTDWMLGEEEAFLDDYRSVFSGASGAALDAAAARLGLDYGGMDCTMLADGRVLVFEANATMLVHTTGALTAKRREATRVRDAMSELLLARSARGRGSRPGL